METTDRPSSGAGWLRLAGPLFAAVALLLSPGCRPPQMGPDPEVFESIDALYTAVSLRDPGHLDRCDRSLTELARAGRLPTAAHDRLASIIADARAGEWEPAQSDLREFMLGQRRQ